MCTFTQSSIFIMWMIYDWSLKGQHFLWSKIIYGQIFMVKFFMVKFLWSKIFYGPLFFEPATKKVNTHVIVVRTSYLCYKFDGSHSWHGTTENSIFWHFLVDEFEKFLLGIIWIFSTFVSLVNNIIFSLHGADCNQYQDTCNEFVAWNKMK